MYNLIDKIKEFEEKFREENNITYPSEYETIPNISDKFEQELAFFEYNNLSKRDIIRRGAYFYSIDGKKTSHAKICEKAEKQLNKNSKDYNYFKNRRFATHYASHGLFPYKGKFHPQMIKGLLNMLNIDSDDLILDPMCGSGTLNVEASLMGIKSIGVDLNPFAVFMTSVKTDCLKLSQSTYEKHKKPPDHYYSEFSERDKDFKNLIKTSSNKDVIKKFFLLSYLDAMGFSRRIRAPMDKLYHQVYQKYDNLLESFLNVKKDIDISIEDSNFSQGDTLSLSNISSNYIDGVITSPPYSFAIDYLENDKPQIEYLGFELDELKEKLLGFKGKNKDEKLKNYFQDMNKILSELNRVLKPSKYLVLILGSNTYQTGGIRLEKNLIESSQKNGFELLQQIQKPIKGRNNTMKKEQILIFKNT